VAFVNSSSSSSTSSRNNSFSEPLSVVKSFNLGKRLPKANLAALYEAFVVGVSQRAMAVEKVNGNFPRSSNFDTANGEKDSPQKIHHRPVREIAHSLFLADPSREPEQSSEAVFRRILSPTAET